jgi:hypothetical protein
MVVKVSRCNIYSEPLSELAIEAFEVAVRQLSGFTRALVIHSFVTSLNWRRKGRLGFGARIS